jgi:hypothetical protein
MSIKCGPLYRPDRYSSIEVFSRRNTPATPGYPVYFVKKERKLQMAEKVVTPDPDEQDSDKDACDIEIEDITPDEDLPPAEGGVA